MHVPARSIPKKMRRFPWSSCHETSTRIHAGASPEDCGRITLFTVRPAVEVSVFLVAEAIQGRDNEISEHQIGVQCSIGRSGYRTVEDNIVRNYARQLRKRLAEHFADEGNAERFVSSSRMVGTSRSFVQVADGNPGVSPQPRAVALAIQPAHAEALESEIPLPNGNGGAG